MRFAIVVCLSLLTISSAADAKRVTRWGSQRVIQRRRINTYRYRARQHLRHAYRRQMSRPIGRTRSGATRVRFSMRRLRALRTQHRLSLRGAGRPLSAEEMAVYRQLELLSRHLNRKKRRRGRAERAVQALERDARHVRRQIAKSINAQIQRERARR
ncbi:MAG: hypothetical protein KC503_20795 [Myxococcales bacterium]|nr:hypothetical protein [Myxococcales bacterium]